MTKPLTEIQARCFGTAEAIRSGLGNMIFDMASFRRSCRSQCLTAGCIAGHAVAKYQPEWWFNGIDNNNIEMEAGLILGLPSKLWPSMFYPWGQGGPQASEITREMAAGVVENWALTGKVVWPRVNPPAKRPPEFAWARDLRCTATVQ